MPRHGDRAGSISAHAEEPRVDSGWRSPPRVYLRARGGTSVVRTPGQLGPGLSPRTRRNRSPLPWLPGLPGSISAHAEEPIRPPSILFINQVYLRARGGTVRPIPPCWTHTGLSPRTRRNLERCVRIGAIVGSISAHAEEPRFCLSARYASRVYLRARGGTSRKKAKGRGAQGLSPRTRRNPLPWALGNGRSKVYLRARGGTLYWSATSQYRSGLSPRTRRNPDRTILGRTGRRSISAHAEEPCIWNGKSTIMTVYLRARGGTHS
ncbi:Hypothetical protein GbCGDNIH1_1629a [Granulibacter bethesdensis CGDNIH1]|uniref:Uncharacterized protein n=1 Tax=Granulibacter bethesdensis (strain ATCC BAA-1260 / CGDNIH1) TaxID=391165 RepID=A0A286M349_GRABC|nr:Hypothetical protein GbCGDNIH1_1629a [Granulibacter bethesdensis CGDNIH1]